MKKNSLTGSEIKALKKRAKKDAFIHAFQDYRNGETYPPIDNKIKIIEDHRPLLVSAFIFNEIRKFNHSRDLMLKNHLVVIKLRGKGINRTIKILPYSKAIAILDEMLANALAEIDSINQSYGSERSLLETECKARALNNNAEILAIYEIKKEKTRRDFAQKTIKQRDFAHKVINEKTRLLNEMKKKLSQSFSRQFMRISYYYSCAQQFNPDLLADCITETDLLRICNTDIMPDYETDLNDLIAVRNRLNN